MFVDTGGWASIVLSTELFHESAVTLAKDAVAAGTQLITTNLVLSELTALLTSPLRIPKIKQMAILRGLRRDPTLKVIFVDASFDTAAWNLWDARPDKTWSFVDCASFIVMQQERLVEALTTDHHFEQAGFVRLLK